MVQTWFVSFENMLKFAPHIEVLRGWKLKLTLHLEVWSLGGD
jgi:hypothetical protein